MRIAFLCAALLSLAGCGSYNYRPPAMGQGGVNSKVIQKPVEEVWTATIPALGKAFYVINNMDKGSGLINVSYSGKPENFVDCGHITSSVQNAMGKRDYSFPGASAYQEYEVMLNGELYAYQRKMELEGRINLIFEALGKNETRVTANTRYVMTKTILVRNMRGQTRSDKDSIPFNSGEGAQFPGQTECRATGSLEKRVLDMIQ